MVNDLYADRTQVASTSRTVYNFAEAYMKIASEQNHPPQPVPERLPTEREVGEMLSNIDLMKRSLEQVRETVQISIQNERAREGAKAKGTYDEDQDVPMYGDGMKPQYPMAEVKKRRGVSSNPAARLGDYFANACSSARPLLGDVIAATG